MIRVLAAFGVAATTAGGANTASVQDFRAPLMSSVETVMASNLSISAVANNSYTQAAQATVAASTSNIATINLASATGTTTVGSQDSSANTFTEFSNAANGTAISLNNADGYTAVQILGATSRTGTTDALNVTISNGSGPTAASAAATGNFGVFSTLSSAAGAAGSAATVDNTFEVLNITTAGAFSRVQADVGTASAANSVTTVNVSGTGTAAASGFALQLSQNQAFQNVTTINASGMTGTGGLYIVATNNAQNLTFTGSANNDRIDLGTITNLTSGDRFTFGAGTDTIGFNDANNSTYTDVQKGLIVATGAERVAFYGAMTNTDLGGYTGITSFSIGSGAAQTSVANAITNIATAQTLIISNDMTGAAGATGNPGATPSDTLTFTGAGVGTTANLSLGGGIDIIGGVGGAGAANTNAGGVGSNAIDFGGNVTTMTIASTGTSVNTIIGGAGGAANAGAGNGNGGAGAAAITSGTTQAYVITGTQDLTILGGAGGAANLAGTAGAQAAGFSAAASINATALTGVLTTSGSNAQDVISTGTGGSKIQQVTVATIATAGDGDSITLNTGRDQIQVTINASNVDAAGLSAANLDVITGLTAGTDKFVFATSLTAVQQGALYTAAGTGTLSTDIATAITAGGAFVANSAAVVTITGTGAGTYVVFNDNTAAFNKGLDAVVQLVGLSGTLSTGDFVTGFLA